MRKKRSFSPEFKRQVIISSTTNRNGLSVKAKLSAKKYETGIKISDEEFGGSKIKPKRFHGDCSYTILRNKGL